MNLKYELGCFPWFEWYFDSWNFSLHANYRTWGLPIHVWWDEHFVHVGILCVFLMYYRKEFQRATREGDY